MTIDSDRLTLRETLPLLLSRRWWWVTLLVIAGMFLLVRLGIWQLERLEWRRGLNAAILSQLEADPLTITSQTRADDLLEVAYRPVTVRGRYDLAEQFVLVQQNYAGQAGNYLFTPLLIEGDDRAILVNRGWLPAGADEPAAWSAFDVTGRVELAGFLRSSQKPPRASLADYDNRVARPERRWFSPFIAALQQQYTYELLPVYLQLQPDPGQPEVLPYRIPLDVDLSEGNHLSYAYQWFAFAVTLGVVYLFLVRRQEQLRLAAPDLTPF